MIPLHGANHTLQQNLIEFTLLLGGMALIGVAVLVRNMRLAGRPVASYTLGVIGGATLILSYVVPSLLGVKVAAVRPSTNATIRIVAPRPGQIFRGTDPTIRVRVRLTGAQIVNTTSAQLSPHTGHMHLYLDGELAQMAYSTGTTISGSPGTHRLKAEFVAVDHGPFNPPVVATVRFRVVR